MNEPRRPKIDFISRATWLDVSILVRRIVATGLCSVSFFVSLSSAAPTDVEYPPSVEERGGNVSIWSEDGSRFAVASIESADLQTGDMAVQDPILVPLPAPVLAAASGLGLVWIFRRRLTRG